MTLKWFVAKIRKFYISLTIFYESTNLIQSTHERKTRTIITAIDSKKHSESYQNTNCWQPLEANYYLQKYNSRDSKQPNTNQNLLKQYDTYRQKLALIPQWTPTDKQEHITIQIKTFLQTRNQYCRLCPLKPIIERSNFRTVFDNSINTKKIFVPSPFLTQIYYSYLPYE